MTKVNRWVSCAALGLAVALGPVPAAGQELPPDIQMDLYLLRADRHVQNEDWAAAMEALDVVFLLQANQGIETPPGLWFTHATAALGAGYPQTAITSATRYLQEAGREGQDYASALALLDEAINRAEGGATPTPVSTPAPPPAAAPGATPPPAPTPQQLAPDPVAEPGGGLGGLTIIFPVVGLNAATMAFTSSGPLTLDASQLNGVAGGFAVAFPVSGPFGVQIGAQFAQKGARVALGEGDMAANADFDFQSVDFTALARISAAQATNLPLYALVGPYASFEVGCRVVVDASDGTTGFSASNDCQDLNTQSIDFGVSGGVGFEVGTGATRINVGVLYNYGLQDIDKTVGETARHRVFNIHAGIARTF